MSRWCAVLVSCCVGFCCAPQSVVAITIPTVYVGNLNNANDPADGDSETAGIQNFGSVYYAYRMGTYDVTVSQYVAFLNAKDPTGANALALYNTSMSDPSLGGVTYSAGAAAGSKYSVTAGRADRPANYVTWFSAARFANWLNNGQGNGDTESGAYLLAGGTPVPSNAATISRQAVAKVFLPSENEWYKAAYYNPASSSYYLYPTSSNIPPTASAPTAVANSANFNSIVGTPTNVGAYSNSASPYGAFDMGGNVFQWNEQLFDGGDRGLRGGMYLTSDAALKSSFRSSFNPQSDFLWGFRVAMIPGPQFPGDIDFNNVVDFTDLNILLTNYGLPSKFATGDFDNSGTINFDDLNTLLTNYGKTAPGLTAPVPEPNSIVLAVLSLCGLLAVARARSSRRA